MSRERKKVYKSDSGMKTSGCDRGLLIFLKYFFRERHIFAFFIDCNLEGMKDRVRRNYQTQFVKLIYSIIMEHKSQMLCRCINSSNKCFYSFGNNLYLIRCVEDIFMINSG